MTDPSLNPYAPPEEGGVAELPGGLWRAGNDCLYFRDGAQLPRVDVFSGGQGGDLVPASQEFAVVRGGRLAVRALALVVFLGVYQGGVYLGYWALSQSVFFLLIVGLSVMLQMTGRVSESRARLSWFVDSAGEKRRQRSRSVVTGMWLVGLVGIVAFGIAGLGGGTGIWGFGVAMAMLIGASIAKRLMKSLRCHGSRDGWFHLRGIDSEALRVLQRLEDAENQRVVEQAEQAEEGRVRKGFTVYLHRFPLGALLRHQWWNPFLVVVMLTLKLRRAKRLEREQYVASEADDLEEKELDPSLRAMLEGVRKDDRFADWKVAEMNRLPAPGGELRTDCVEMVDPTGRYVLVLAVVRVGTGNYSREIAETTFRSWTRDGVVWLTGNIPMIPPWPEWIEVERVKGNLGEVWESHLARLGDRELQAVEIGEVLRRLEIEAEERRAAYERKGFYGPVRDLADPPAIAR